MPTLDPSSDAYTLYESDTAEGDSGTTRPETIDDPGDPMRPHDGRVPFSPSEPTDAKTPSVEVTPEPLSGGVHPHDDGIPFSHVERRVPATPPVERPVSSPALNSWLVDATIYLSDETAAEDVKAALVETIAHFDIDVYSSGEPRVGSWFQRLTLRIRKAVGEPAVAERLTKLERALEIQLLDKPQSQVNAADGGAVAGLITALDKTNNAMITIGSILLVKANGLVAVRNLSVSEMQALERNPSWTMDPGTAMRYLQELQDRDRAAELAARQVPALQDSQAKP